MARLQKNTKKQGGYVDSQAYPFDFLVHSCKRVTSLLPHSAARRQQVHCTREHQVHRAFTTRLHIERDIWLSGESRGNPGADVGCTLGKGRYQETTSESRPFATDSTLRVEPLQVLFIYFFESGNDVGNSSVPRRRLQTSLAQSCVMRAFVRCPVHDAQIGSSKAKAGARTQGRQGSAPPRVRPCLRVGACYQG